MSVEEEYQNRLKHVEDLKALGVSAYPNGLIVDHTAAEVVGLFDAKSKEELELVSERFTVAGRVMLLRSFGKAAFWKLKDRTGQIQVFVE